VHNTQELRTIAVDTASRVAEIFLRRFGHACAGIARAPGRVNLLGEHVDYNDGFVLPAATDRATYVAFAASDSQESQLWAQDYQQETRFSPQSLQEKRSIAGTDLPAWGKYPAGVAWALMQASLPVSGLKAAYASDVPRGAGLSSSASVELAFAMAWLHIGAASLAPMELARLCQQAENRYVGVNCGIMDQAASACSEHGRVMHLDCRSLEYQTLPLPEGVVIVVADSGVRHTLAGSAYNDRRAVCEQAVALLKRHLPGIRALRDVSPADFNRLAPDMPHEVQMRARHVVQEIDRTQRAVKLLRSGDMRAFGALMNECHASLRDLYEVSCPELDVLTSVAQSLTGCYGARLTGAGFGGCTVNLVEGTQANAFVQALRRGYKASAQRHAEIYICTASQGANILTPSELAGQKMT
jgi:galactokinase